MVVVDVDGAAMCSHDVGDDGQAEARAAGVARTSIVEADEPLEDVAPLGGRDAGTVVGDGQRCRGCSGIDGAAGVGVTTRSVCSSMVTVL